MLVYKSCFFSFFLHNEWIIEHGVIETNEHNITIMSHMTHKDSVWPIMIYMTLDSGTNHKPNICQIEGILGFGHMVMMGHMGNSMRPLGHSFFETLLPLVIIRTFPSSFLFNSNCKTITQPQRVMLHKFSSSHNPILLNIYDSIEKLNWMPPLIDSWQMNYYFRIHQKVWFELNMQFMNCKLDQL